MTTTKCSSLFSIYSQRFVVLKVAPAYVCVCVCVRACVKVLHSGFSKHLTSETCLNNIFIKSNFHVAKLVHR